MHLQYFHISFFFIDQIIIIGGKMTDAMEGTEVIHVNDIGYDNFFFQNLLGRIILNPYYFVLKMFK